MEFKEQLLEERKDYFIKANGGISLPAAGVIYWLAFGIAGFYLPKDLWTYAAFFASGLMFPIGMLLSKPLKSNLMVKSALASVVFPALLSMLMTWPITIAATFINLDLVPLSLAIGMAMHWPVIGWMYNCKSCLIHAFARGILVTAVWFILPEYRFTIVPILVSVIYFITIIGIKLELKKLK